MSFTHTKPSLFELRWMTPIGWEMLQAQHKSSLLETAAFYIRSYRLVEIRQLRGAKLMRIISWVDGVERRFDGVPGPLKGKTYAPRKG